MKVKQILTVSIIVILCSLVSYVLAQGGAPEWSNFYHEPTVVTILDPVTINVTWYDNESLDTIIIWENSTGEWVGIQWVIQ